MICLMKGEKNLGDVATTKGWSDVIDYAQSDKKAATLNNLQLFLKNGETKFPKTVGKQMHTLATTCTKQDVRNTLMHVSELLEKQRGDVLVTTG
jgi:hypothetical protein